MAHFDEHALETAIAELFRREGYDCVCGNEIARDKRDVVLREDFRAYLRERYAEQGITQTEIERALATLTASAGASLYESNAETYRLITEGFSLKRDDAALPNLFIEPIDFGGNGAAKNRFKIVNQFEIDGAETRIPDGVVFVNGLPVVVLEFKSAVREDATIADAFTQLTVRYRRDIPELFRYNAFVVVSDGVNSRYGSLFAPYDFFYAWKKVEPGDKAAEGVASLRTLVRGMFRKERLLCVMKDFVFLPDSSKSERKIVCRCPQFFAARRLFENILAHSKMRGGDGKGGTYFGATGCGKSCTMLFLTRMLMRSREFASPTVVLITDRADLDAQLSALFGNAKKFIGDDCVTAVESRANLRELLAGRTSGGVFLTTIQKFTEDARLLSARANIICISDEAHRSQTNLLPQVKLTESGVRRSCGFAKYLHDSFPNATYVGFTGTPIDATLDVFGDVVDAYTMTESVADGITRRIVYEGRAAKVLLDGAKLREIEKYYEQCANDGASEYQIEASKRAVTQMERILGDPDRLRAVAEDFVAHYEKRLEEGSTVRGKAMFVCSNRTIACNLYKKILALRSEWGAIAARGNAENATAFGEGAFRMAAENRFAPYGNAPRPCEKMKLVMTRSKDDPVALYGLLGTDEDRAAWADLFKNPESDFKIAIVVDMWITGFDAPCLDTMYIDKPLQMHTLVQTISRVNRVFPGKEKGLVVDYFGIKNSMNAALKKYASGECDERSVETAEKSVTLVKDQLDILRRMFSKFDYSAFSTGTPLEQLECLNLGAEFAQATRERETLFMGHAKKLKSAFNLCCGNAAISEREREEIHYFCGVRAILAKLSCGNAPDVSQMNRRVAKMIEEAIRSEGVEEIVQVGTETESLDLLGEEYMARLEKLKLPNTKIRLMERLLRTVIAEFKKVNKAKGIDFSQRLGALVARYNDRSDSAVFADEVLTDVDDKSRYTDWARRDDIKAELKMDLVLVLAAHGYPPVPQDEVFKEIFEQAENFKKYNA